MNPVVRKGRTKGFTLVEVLIALTLTAVLVVLLFEALHTYAIANSAGYAVVQRQETTASLRAFLRKQLREIVPLGINTSSGRELFFSGEAHTMSYSGRIPSHRAPGGLYKLSFEVEGSSPDQSLRFRYARIPSGEDLEEEDIFDFSDAAAKVMIASATSVSFEYFGALESGADATWIDRWPRRDQIPEMVRIRFRPSDSNIESSVTAPIYANGDTKRTALRGMSTKNARLRNGFGPKGSARTQNGKLPTRPGLDR